MEIVGIVGAAAGPRKGRGPGRAQDIDRHVGARVRERRVMLGLTQHQMAERTGITYQQVHKYEKGINRISAGRLFLFAQVQGVEVGHFFEGLGDEGRAPAPNGQWRLLLELARSFMALPRPHQQALCALARALVDPDAPHGDGDGEERRTGRVAA